MGGNAGEGSQVVERADISQVLAQMRLVQSQISRPQNEIVPGAIAPGQLARPQDGQIGRAHV